jgi:hypothetical protein
VISTRKTARRVCRCCTDRDEGTRFWLSRVHAIEPGFRSDNRNTDWCRARSERSDKSGGEAGRTIRSWSKDSSDNRATTKVAPCVRWHDSASAAGRTVGPAVAEAVATATVRRTPVQAIRCRKAATGRTRAAPRMGREQKHLHTRVRRSGPSGSKGGWPGRFHERRFASVGSTGAKVRLDGGVTVRRRSCLVHRRFPDNLDSRKHPLRPTRCRSCLSLPMR